MGNGRIRKKENKFTQVSNNVLMDESMSLKAIGLYSKINYYLNIPNWDLYKSHLVSKCKEGRDSFSSAWEELKGKGYLVQYRMQDEKGKYYYEYELLDEVPTYGKSVYGKPVTGKSVHGETVHGKPVSINNKDFNKILQSNIIQSNNHTQGDSENVCGDSQNQKNLSKKELEFILKDIHKVLNEKSINMTTLKELINECGIFRVHQYINTWDKYRDHAKKTQSAYFIYCIQRELPVPQIKASTSNNNKQETFRNFDEREYDEKDFDRFYANLNDDNDDNDK